MVTGLNTVFRHDGKEYHLQTEDLGREAAAFEVRVYDQGSVVWLKRISYADLAAQELPTVEHQKKMRATMEKTLRTVEAAIARGKIG